MNHPRKYLLLLDPRQEILSLQETALSCFYGGDVYSFKNSTQAFDTLKSKGSPELIIIDAKLVSEDESSFYNYLQTNKISVPIIATMTEVVDNELLSTYPSITAVIEKPASAASFSYLVRSLSNETSIMPSHVPIKTSLLLRHSLGLFDLYLKLADKNYVKILHKGEPFSDADSKRLSDKGIYELFIKFEDSKEFLSFLENEITGKGQTIEDITLTVENLESFERVAKYMNWSPTVLLAAQKSVTHAVKILSKNQNVLSVLKRRLSEPTSEYSRHIGLLTYLVCAFSSTVSAMGESGQIKLALAALIHDAAVDDEFYANIKEWNKRACDPTDKSPEVIRYRMHPFEGSKIVKSLDSHSPDVDQIILQHHEVKNGKGFPRGLDSHRIGFLPALFIIVEDLVEFIDNGDNIETSIVDFMTWGSAYYDNGHFKKIFMTFEEKLKQL